MCVWSCDTVQHVLYVYPECMLGHVHPLDSIESAASEVHSKLSTFVIGELFMMFGKWSNDERKDAFYMFTVNNLDSGIRLHCWLAFAPRMRICFLFRFGVTHSLGSTCPFLFRCSFIRMSVSLSESVQF